MKKEQAKERVSINIDKSSLKWIQDQINKGEFDNQSAAIRKCITIAKRVYEQANSDEMVRFIHGK
jgi:Arc/MetJ-type ribon-helix-helix transcriptional regulator